MTNKYSELVSKHSKCLIHEYLISIRSSIMFLFKCNVLIERVRDEEVKNMIQALPNIYSAFIQPQV